MLRRIAIRFARRNDRADLLGVPASGIRGRGEWRMKGILLLIALAIPAMAQSNDAPTEALPPTFHCGDRDDLKMSGKDKVCYWWTQSFNASMLFGAAFNTALDPVLNGST